MDEDWDERVYNWIYEGNSKPDLVEMYIDLLKETGGYEDLVKEVKAAFEGVDE